MTYAAHNFVPSMPIFALLNECQEIEVTRDERMAE